MTFTPITLRIANQIEVGIQAAQNAGRLPALSLDDIKITVNRVKKDKPGDYSVPVAMTLAKPMGMKPLDVAQAIYENLPQESLFSKVEVAPPGFLNFWIEPLWLKAQLNTIIESGDRVFQQAIGKGKRVNVEFVSANPTGPLHIGRTRGAVVGDSIARLMEICGYDVHREYYFNNGGRQMMLLGKSLQARYLQALGLEAEFPEDGYKGQDIEAMGKQLATEVGDGWKDKDWLPFKDYAEEKNFEGIRNTLARIGIVMDLYFPELSLYEKDIWNALERLKDGGFIYKAAVHAGASEDEIASTEEKGMGEATWFRSTQFSDDKDRILVRSNGEPTYVLPDVAYHINKINRGFDLMIDVFGSDHYTESQVVNYCLQALDYDTTKVQVVLTQWVHLLRDGQTIAQSTRKGDAIPLDDLIDEIGADAVRYFMQQRSPDTTLNFDLDLAVKQSNENPVYYIQNAHVRCAGILRQVAERGYPDDWDTDADLTLLGELEIEFIQKMLEFPEIIIFAHDNIVPHQIAFWTLELARAFHPLYDNIRVLHTEVPEPLAKARLRLYRAAKVVFKRALTLMGMTAPEHM